MRRRSILLTFAILLVAVALAVAGLGYVTGQVPPYYAAATQEDNAPAQVASEVITRFADMQNKIRTGQSEWGAGFTAPELNAILREQFDEGTMFAELLPKGVHAPRIAIEGDRLKIAARYRAGPTAALDFDCLSTVLSVELRMWVVRQERNTVAVELCGVWAGDLPIGSQRYLDRLVEVARRANIDVNWYRANGNPVALLKLYADQVQPSTVIRTVKVGDDRLTLGGKSVGLFAAQPPAAEEAGP